MSLTPARRAERPPSNSVVDRAGLVLRDLTFDDIEGVDDAKDLLDAFDVVADHRQAHAFPLAIATTQLAEILEHTIGGDPVVAQRLKRMPQIVHKLRRHQRMKLARMQDIAGCRAVLTNGDEVEDVRSAIRGAWEVRTEFDYRADGKPDTGYRGLHLVVLQPDGDRTRMVEVQLRTEAQHRWAIAVERAARVLRCALKDGSGPVAAVEYFRLASDAIDARERDGWESQALVRRLADLRVEVRALAEAA